MGLGLLEEEKNEEGKGIKMKEKERDWGGKGKKRVNLVFVVGAVDNVLVVAAGLGKRFYNRAISWYRPLPFQLFGVESLNKVRVGNKINYVRISSVFLLALYQ